MIDYSGKLVVIATMHGKEQVIAPILRNKLNMNPVLPIGLNTDKLGTFSGEIERPASSIDTLRMKCELGMDLANTTLGIASEGSFGPHPYLPFVSCNEEFMIFMDRENDIEIIERRISTETNFLVHQIEDEYELLESMKRFDLDESGIILVGKGEKHTRAIKDLNSLNELRSAFNELRPQFSIVELHTDMRAHKNPTRLKVIQTLAEELADRISAKCPSCSTPGFGVTGTKSGLPCSLCGYPTKSTLAHIQSCIRCNFTSELIFPNGIQYEDPTYCDICNP